MPLTTSTAASARRSVAAAKRPATTFSRQSSWGPRVTERGITLTFPSGARVDLLDEEAAWIRDELVRGEYTSPKRDAGTVVDRALGAIDEDIEPSLADMTSANVVELAWALRGMPDHNSDRFIGSPLLMHLRDLLFIELERGREER